MARAPRIQSVVTEQPRAGRKIRRPVHTFNIVQQPYAITPFLIAPVIPGETLRNAVVQARTVSSPIKNDLVGWWLEHYLFYVKARDLNIRDDVLNMFVDPDWTPSGLTDNTADPVYNHLGRNRINWPKHCLQRITETYFRNEGEAWDAWTYEGLPIASVNTDNFTDSLISDEAYVEADIDVDLNADDTVMASEVDAAMRQYEILRMNNLVDMTYEDFLRTYGIQGGAAAPITDENRPELIRYEKSWTLPSNTVEVDGIRSVVSWSQAFRADKDRFFSEPGFIFGVTVARPKIYMGNVKMAGVSLMDNIRAWLPAVLHDDPFTSLTKVADGTGPIETDPDDYWVDVRDLLIHGDQWINHSGDHNAMALPSATTFDKRYAAAGDIEALFVDPETTVLRTDGIATFMIASRNATDRTIQTGASVTVSP